jgi:hypothetical protein
MQPFEMICKDNRQPCFKMMYASFSGRVVKGSLSWQLVNTALFKTDNQLPSFYKNVNSLEDVRRLAPFFPDQLIPLTGRHIQWPWQTIETGCCRKAHCDWRKKNNILASVGMAVPGSVVQSIEPTQAADHVHIRLPGPGCNGQSQRYVYG